MPWPASALPARHRCHRLPQLGMGQQPRHWQNPPGCFRWVRLFAACFQCCFSRCLELLTVPPLAAAPREPSPLVALGSPVLVSVGTPRVCSRGITMRYARVCCIYEIIVENHQSSASKCLHVARHCFLSPWRLRGGWGRGARTYVFLRVRKLALSFHHNVHTNCYSRTGLPLPDVPQAHPPRTVLAFQLYRWFLGVFGHAHSQFTQFGGGCALTISL